MGITKEMRQNTGDYYRQMVESGIEPIIWSEFLSRLDSLGYRICKRDTFKYYNTSNPPDKWLAESLYIVEADTGRSFAHKESRRDGHFWDLQDLRLGTICMHNGRIVEA